MKRLALLFIFITYSFSLDNNYEQKLYEKILPAIYKKTNVIYFPDKKSELILKNSTVLKHTSNCKDADILIGKSFNKIPSVCKNKPQFSTNYRSFLNNRNTIGAFYWRKGRPQIKFKLDNLDKFNLELPKSLMEFGE